MSIGQILLHDSLAANMDRRARLRLDTGGRCDRHPVGAGSIRRAVATASIDPGQADPNQVDFSPAARAPEFCRGNMVALATSNQAWRWTSSNARHESSA